MSCTGETHGARKFGVVAPLAGSQIHLPRIDPPIIPFVDDGIIGRDDWKVLPAIQHMESMIPLVGLLSLHFKVVAAASGTRSSHFGSSLSLLTRDRRVTLLFVRRRSVTIRKGWTKVEVPDGWLQVIRGKRPPSVQWRHVQDLSNMFVRRQVRRQPAARVCPGSIEGSSKRVDPEDPSIALQPEDKEERQALLTALEKAKRQAEVPSMEQQIHATEEYLAKAKKRLLQHDATIAAAREAMLKAEHDKEFDVQGVADEEDLLRKLKTQAADPTLPVPVADPVGEVAQLQQVVADLQRQLQQHAAPVVPTQGVSAVPSISPFRIRKREDYVPATEHEVLEWMTDRQEEMIAALMARNPTEAARISSLITDATRSLQPESVPPSMVTNMAVRMAQEARTISRYGVARFPGWRSFESRTSPSSKTPQSITKQDWLVTSFLG